MDEDYEDDGDPWYHLVGCSDDCDGTTKMDGGFVVVPCPCSCHDAERD